MSAFAAVLRRSAGVRPEELRRLLDDESIEVGIVECPRAGLAARPAAALVQDPDLGVDLVFSGRLDNRRELLESLGDGPEPGGSIGGASDARSVLAAFRKWGPHGFDRLLGPFAVLVYDRRRHAVVGVRDGLGDRTLYYWRGREEVIVASEVSMILRHPAVSDTLDEVALAHFFAVEAAPPGVTFWADVRELPPGHGLTLDLDRQHLERTWRPEDLPRIRYRRDVDYVEHFRELLEESVRCRLPSSGPAAILMSGGMDSTSVAALAATELAESAPGTPVHAVSWVFDELAAADERPYIDSMIARFGLVGHPIPGDEEWPLRDLPTWPVPPDAPWQGLYCRLQEAAYRRAREVGATVLLTGELGDHLYYVDDAFWLRELIVARRGRVWRELRAEISKYGLGSIWRSGPTRSALARAVGWRGRPVASPAWLEPSARRLVDASRRLTVPIPARDRARPYPPVLDPRCAVAAGLERSKARRAGIDVRRPFRDRRLIEFVLASPAHLLYRPGSTKWILREALRGILPEVVRSRQHVSTLLPLAARGLVDKEIDVVLDVLRRPDALWRRFVSHDWLVATFPSRLLRGLDGIESVIAWQCVCGQLWLDKIKNT